MSAILDFVAELAEAEKGFRAIVAGGDQILGMRLSTSLTPSTMAELKKKKAYYSALLEIIQQAQSVMDNLLTNGYENPMQFDIDIGEMENFKEHVRLDFDLKLKQIKDFSEGLPTKQIGADKATITGQKK